MTSRIRFINFKTLITALLPLPTCSTKQPNKMAPGNVAAVPCLHRLSMLADSSVPWFLLMVTPTPQSMQWNLSCETHELLWILNFHSYSPGTATVLSQFKFQSMLSCKLLKQSNLYHSIYSHILLRSHKQIRGYILYCLCCIPWMRHNIRIFYSIYC